MNVNFKMLVVFFLYCRIIMYNREYICRNLISDVRVIHRLQKINRLYKTDCINIAL